MSRFSFDAQAARQAHKAERARFVIGALRHLRDPEVVPMPEPPDPAADLLNQLTNSEAARDAEGLHR